MQNVGHEVQHRTSEPLQKTMQNVGQQFVKCGTDFVSHLGQNEKHVKL